MELKLYNRLKNALLGEFASRAENNDRDYQQQVEAFASAASSGVPQPMARKIRGWLDSYNRLLTKPFKLRYYQILALYFTEHVLAAKRAGKDFADQKALVYWMATGSGKTLLMHLNILQYIEHIGGGQAFDELQIIVTTPGVNLIEQHERELGEVVRLLNRQYNNRIKLIVATTGALLNKEPGFFNLTGSTREFRLVLVDEGHIGLSGGGKDAGAFKQLRHNLIAPDNAFLFEYSATYHGIADKHVAGYEEQIVYDYNYYRFFKDGYGKDYALQSLNDDRFADTGKSEAAFFTATFDTLRDKLDAHARLSVSQSQGAGQLPFAGRFPDKPLIAFMGNTVEDPKKEGSDKDEVSDIRKFVIWLAHLTPAERGAYAPVFNGEHAGMLTLTRSPGISDEIWLSWGEGHYWGLINVGNGEKFFSGCEEHPQLRDANGEPRVVLNKAAIVHARYHFDAIDDPASPINVLVGSRKFAEGWNCFRVSIIGLINLGSSKGNKIIQIFGRGVRLKGLRHDGKRRYGEHCLDYAELVDETPENQLRRLETLNVYSLRKSWLQTFLDALEADLPAIAGPYHLDVQPAVVQIGTAAGKRKPATFADYQQKLHAFKVGRSEFDAPLRLTLDAASNDWHWEYMADGTLQQGHFANPGITLDYRANREPDGENILPAMLEILDAKFATRAALRDRLRNWSREQRVQMYVRHNGAQSRLDAKALLATAQSVKYDEALTERGDAAVTRLLEEAQRDLLEKIFHKARYDIDKRQYRYDVVRQSAAGAPGDFIERYRLTYEFGSLEHKRQFESDPALRTQLELKLQEARGDYHIYEPLLSSIEDNTVLQKVLSSHKPKLTHIGISPDALNAGERKFLRDMVEFIDANYSRDPREFYLMRNVESLRSIGVYLDGETRAFYPDFVLWIVDDKANKTTLALFDPKGQTGITKDDDLGLGSGSAMNDKVRIATSGQLAELARELEVKTRRHWSIHSFILLRDKSPLGKWKGAAPTDKEMELAESMIQRHVLRLDWHRRNELGQAVEPLRGGDSYLSRIFGILCA